MIELPENKKIILFDGVCNLCNNAVNFIIEYDKKDVFRFASLQSEIGKQLTLERRIDTEKIDSIILIEPGKAYHIKSNAALHIAQELKGGYQLLGQLLFLPGGFRNFVYDFIAKNRYKWYGKKDNCRIPSPELKAKFLN